jgi:membrane protease YdiL (CAAX protease family)
MELPAPLPDEAIQPGPPVDAGAVERPIPPEDPLDVPAPSPRPPHPNFWYGSLWCVGFLIFINGTVIAVLCLTVAASAVLSQDPRAYLTHLTIDGKVAPELNCQLAYALLAAEVGSVALGFLVIRLVVGRDWLRRLAIRPPSTAHLLLVLVALPALILLPGIVHHYAGKVVPSLGVTQGNVELFGSWPLWFGVLVVGVLPGIGEELWCRGFLGRGFVGHYGWFAGVLLTSLWFGTLHVDPPLIMGTALMGVFLHYIYAMSRSLPLSMLLHALNNSIAVVLSQPQIGEGLPDIDVVARQPLVVGAILLLLVTVAWALFQSRARLVAENGRPPWRPVFSGVELPPPDSGTRVARPWPGVVAWALVLAAVACFGVEFYLGLQRLNLPG